MKAKKTSSKVCKDDNIVEVCPTPARTKARKTSAKVCKDDDIVEVNTLWIGKTLPEFVPLCLQSYLDTGHRVSWWVYAHERKEDFAKPAMQEMLKHDQLRIRDAGTIFAFDVAQKFWFHGIGDNAQYAGWAVFSDLFRYELLARQGGWWVDGDSVSVRSLKDLTADSIVVCTERHRGDRRSTGAVAVPDQDITEELGASAKFMIPPEVEEHDDEGTLDGNTGAKCLRILHEWLRCTVLPAKYDPCLITNSHIYVPAAAKEWMSELARDLRGVLEHYAESVRKKGVAFVQRRKDFPRGGGLVGMVAFQKAIRTLLRNELKLRSSERTLSCHVVHWRVFNPIEAIDAAGMADVLAGREVLKGSSVRSLHIFRQVRDYWQERGARMPPLSVQVSDETPTKHVSVKRERTSRPEKPIETREVASDGGPLLKRQRIRPLVGTAAEASPLGASTLLGGAVASVKQPSLPSQLYLDWVVPDAWSEFYLADGEFQTWIDQA